MSSYVPSMGVDSFPLWTVAFECLGVCTPPCVPYCSFESALFVSRDLSWVYCSIPFVDVVSTRRSSNHRFNQLADFHFLAGLSRCPALRVLRLSDNPIAEHPLYRLLCVACLPRLRELDNEEVTPQERSQALLHVAQHSLASLSNRVWNCHQFLRSALHTVCIDPTPLLCSAPLAGHPRASILCSDAASGTGSPLSPSSTSMALAQQRQPSADGLLWFVCCWS